MDKHFSWGIIRLY